MSESEQVRSNIRRMISIDRLGIFFAFLFLLTGDGMNSWKVSTEIGMHLNEQPYLAFEDRSAEWSQKYAV